MSEENTAPQPDTQAQMNSMQKQIDQLTAQVKYFSHENNAAKAMTNDQLSICLQLRTALGQIQERNNELEKQNQAFVAHVQNLLVKNSEFETLIEDYKRRDEQLSQALSEANSAKIHDSLSEGSAAEAA